MVAIAVGSMLMLAVMAIFAFSNRSFAALGNYVALDRQSRSTLDKMTQEIRMTASVSSWDTNYLFFNNYDGSFLCYIYYPWNKCLVRYRFSGGYWEMGNLLNSNCTSLNFRMFQRTPNTNFGNFAPTYSLYQTACKLIQMNWICSTNVLGTRATTESVQSAKVVIRNQ